MKDHATTQTNPSTGIATLPRGKSPDASRDAFPQERTAILAASVDVQTQTASETFRTGLAARLERLQAAHDSLEGEPAASELREALARDLAAIRRQLTFAEGTKADHRLMIRSNVRIIRHRLQRAEQRLERLRKAA